MQQIQKEIEFPKENIYTITISKKLQNRINYLCNKFPDREWSGTLFYSIIGEFNTSLKITAEDLYLQDIGDGVSTTYEEGNDLASYMLDNNLIDCKRGLIHSHNRMSAFFSSIDTKTLEEEGKNYNHFLSLIVCNNGQYKCKITAKQNLIINISGSYTTFDGKEISLNPRNEVKTKVISFDVFVDRQEEEYRDEQLDNIIKSITDKQTVNHRFTSDLQDTNDHLSWDYNFSENPIYGNKTITDEGNIFKEVENKEENKKEKVIKNNEDDAIRNIACSIMTLSFTGNNDFSDNEAPELANDMDYYFEELSSLSYSDFKEFILNWKNSLVKIYSISNKLTDKEKEEFNSKLIKYFDNIEAEIEVECKWLEKIIRIFRNE